VSAPPQPRGVNRAPAPAAAPGSARAVRLPTRPRRLGQWAATVMFVLGSVLAAGWFWQQRGDRVEVLVVEAAIPAGHVVAQGDLTSGSVSGVTGAIPVGDLDRVVGSSAATGLVPGQVLTEGMLTRAPMPATGQRVVGVQVDATRAPAGLEAGDVVTVLAVPPSGDPSDLRTLGSPTVLTASASVFDAVGIEGAGTRISLVVGDRDANRVATFAAAGRVALVQAPIGSGR
jgi:hypothetical protein